MNNTFISLVLRSKYFNSPFYSNGQHFSKNKFEFIDSSFRYISNPIIYSRSNVLGKVQKSSFNNILNGAIKLDCANYHKSKYDSSQTFSENFFEIKECIFEKCHNQGNGGAIESNRANFTVIDVIFRYNSAQIGGAAHILRSWECVFSRVSVYKNKAEYAAGIHYDSMNEQNTTQFYFMNFTQNIATKWTGAFRIDHGGGKLYDLAFFQNEALVSSGYLDYSWKPVHKFLKRWLVRNNTATSRGAGITMFHIRASAEIEESLFIDNRCEISADSISIENVDGYFKLENCFFSGQKDKEVSTKFGETELLFVNCSFEQNLNGKWDSMVKLFQNPNITV